MSRKIYGTPVATPINPKKLHKGCVKTVNGTAPDENGNVELAGGGIGEGIDKTLTQEGQAADAAAVGNALKEKAASRHIHSALDIYDFPATDKTLSKENFAADAKTVGDALTGKAASTHGHVIKDISDFPASMPASDVYAWAKQPNKPSYTAAEVGALSGTDATLTQGGKAADAKATGEKFGTVTGNISGLAESIEVERARITNLSTLPNGSTIGDAELADIRVGRFGESYGNAGEAVRGQVGYTLDESASLAEDTKENAQLLRISNGHFFKIHTDNMHQVGKLFKSGSTVVVDGTVAGSDYIKCPKYVCVHFPNDDARCRLYFYKLENGKYVPRWDIVDTTGSSSSGYPKNYLSNANSGTFLFEMPDDNVYLAFQSTTGCELYGWDGEPFGVPISADDTIIATDGTTGSLNSSGTGGVTIPGTAKAYVCKFGSAVHSLFGVKNGVKTAIYTKAHQFYALPEGYDFFRVRFFAEYTTTTGSPKVTRTGDVSDCICVVWDTNCTAAPVTRAKKIMENAKKLCAIKWSPVANISISGGTDKNGPWFRNGVTYNGLPYGSDWTKAHYIGWHVSPHTFLNAVNDAASIFYKEKVGENAPYYGTVCSAFATMASGFPYPANNGGLTLDPRVEYMRSTVPVVGSVWSNVTGHCVVPERIDIAPEGVTAVAAYESVSPISMRTVRYSNVTRETDLSLHNTSTDYYDEYGVAAYHMDATGDLSHLPYADLADVEIVNGGARPYKGDKSVYTSAEGSVKINIKNASATTLYLQKDGGTAQGIAINGATQIDVYSKLSGDGIYWVYTDVDSTRESFEFVTAEPIEYTITNGKISFSRNDFWYAWCSMSGNEYYAPGNMRANVPANSKNDYSNWAKVCDMKEVIAIFQKGTYGAYTVPFVKKV